MSRPAKKTAISTPRQLDDLKTVLVNRRAALLSEVHERIRDVRGDGNVDRGGVDEAESAEVGVQDDIGFALIQMNMGREVCRRLREANDRLFSAKMGVPDTDGHLFLAA